MSTEPVGETSAPSFAAIVSSLNQDEYNSLVRDAMKWRRQNASSQTAPPPMPKLDGPEWGAFGILYSHQEYDAKRFQALKDFVLILAERVKVLEGR